jgi:hypothetical protein
LESEVEDVAVMSGESADAAAGENRAMFNYNVGQHCVQDLIELRILPYRSIAGRCAAVN